MINAEVILTQGEDVRLAKVIRRNVDSNGQVLGYYKEIPMLNTILYDVQFPYGAIQTYSANLVAENILTQVDADGYHNKLLEGLLDHYKDKRAVEKKDQWIVTKRGRQSMRQTTVGWKFCMKWEDGTFSWTYLKYIKESNPIEVTEYLTACNIQDEPVFLGGHPLTFKSKTESLQYITPASGKQHVSMA